MAPSAGSAACASPQQLQFALQAQPAMRLLFTLTEIPFGVALGAGVAVNLHGAIRIECESFGVSMELHDISTPALDV